MSKLFNVCTVNQNQLLEAYTFAIEMNENLLVFGPSGAGKTDMAFQTTQEAGGNCIYWNMSVMERPDIQGIPALSNDKRTSFFAPQEGLPYVGMEDVSQERALSLIRETIKGKDEFKALDEVAQKELDNIAHRKLVEALKKTKNLFAASMLAAFGDDLDKVGNENSKNILLLDEVDKTPPENLQPLLEILLYRKVNGRPLNIQSVIMTANLPDEHTFSEQLSHAITNRALVLELVPDSKIWLEWAYQHDLHPMVTGFLSRDTNAAEFFNKKPSNDVYCYAYTSARAWAAASRVNKKIDTWIKLRDEKSKKKGKSKPDDFSERKVDYEALRYKMNAAVLGQEAATKLLVWLQYFSKYDKVIDKIFEGGNDRIPDLKGEADASTAAIVVAVALAARFRHFITKGDYSTKEVQAKAKHVFSWISDTQNCPKDIQAVAYRAAFEKDSFMKHNLHTFEFTKKLWSDLAEKYNAMNAIHRSDKI